jgi:hypothetical protein
MTVSGSTIAKALVEGRKPIEAGKDQTVESIEN